MSHRTQSLEKVTQQLARFEEVAHRASPETRATIRFLLAERILDLGGPPSLLSCYPPRTAARAPTVPQQGIPNRPGTERWIDLDAK